MNGKSRSLLAPLLLGLLLAPILLAQPALAQLEPVPPVEIDIGRGGEVTLDGALDEPAWSEAPVTELPLRLYRPQPEPSDLSGRFRAIWREEGLYVAVEVRDDALVLASDRTDLWDYDSAEVWIGNLWLQASPDPEGATLLRWTFAKGGQASVAEPSAAVAKGENGYTVELFVPRALFEAASGVDLAEGASFRFAVGLRDRDEGEREASSPLYFPPRFGWNNVESMAVATLR